MSPRIVATIVFCMCAATAAAAPEADTYLKPDLKAGEKLTDVYSKTVSLSSEGFQSKVSRYSGSSGYTITAVTPEAIVADEIDRGDGQPASPAVHGVKFLADEVTVCYRGKCAINAQTSGLVFNRLLWGNAPHELNAGVSWTVKVDNPWEIGPAGTEQVRIVGVDPANGGITLARSGSGKGPSSDELQRGGNPIEITAADGRKIEVSLIPGTTSWSGYTTVRRGVIVGDEIMTTQKVMLKAKDGRTFDGELRTYTLLDLAGDTI